jgi:16S rRNA (cytosine967-C5)-methyltransferase
LSCLHFVVQDARISAGQELFDRVLADVPCSATGIFGRHPDARWRKKTEHLPALAVRQREILARAFAHLRPGGVLVYSTCSLEREENEEIVEQFLAGENSAQLEVASEFLSEHTCADRYVQTVPGRHVGDGAFAARIRKNSA